MARLDQGSSGGGQALDEIVAVQALLASPEDLLARWRTERDGANKALSALPPDQMVPWVVRSIPAGVLTCAGIMELFAHGLTGPGADFCLLVTRRRHRADLALRATGKVADHWLDIAQAYRGAPGTGRTPGQFSDRTIA